MTARATSYHELLAFPDDAGGPAAPRRLAVGDGVTALALAGGEPRLAPAPADGGAGPPGAGVLLESLRSGRAIALLAAAAAPAGLRVNGGAAVTVAVLEAGDVFELIGARWTFRCVAVLEARPGRLPEELSARACPVCTTAAGEARVYICPGCGAVIHDELQDRDDALRCLALCSTCPGCGGPIVAGTQRIDPEPWEA